MSFLHYLLGLEFIDSAHLLRWYSATPEADLTANISIVKFCAVIGFKTRLIFTGSSINGILLLSSQPAIAKKPRPSRRTNFDKISSLHRSSPLNYLYPTAIISRGSD